MENGKEMGASGEGFLGGGRDDGGRENDTSRREGTGEMTVARVDRSSGTREEENRSQRRSGRNERRKKRTDWR